MAVSYLEKRDDAARFTQAYRLCPLCEAEELEYEFVIDRVAFSHCRACGLLFANPRSTGEARPSDGLEAAYPSLHAFAERILGRPAASTLMLADGATIDADARFDIIVAAGLIEHAADPVAFAQRVRDHLTADGVLVVTGPSVMSKDALAQRDRWPFFRSKAAWYFDVDTLQQVLTRAGFGGFMPVVDARDCVAQASPELERYFGSNLAMFARPAVPPARRLLSVIVPVYNEAGTVVELLDRVLAKTIDGVEIEVIIVESNSSDGSRELVTRYAQDPRVKLVLDERPRGKGYAVRLGLQHAAGEVILFQDADLEYDVNDYDRLVEPLFALRRNFVLGSRHGAAGEGWKIRRFDDRRTTSSLMNIAHVGLLTMFNRLYGQSLFDPFTMYKVFRRDCLAGLTFECNRFDFDFEICIKLLRKGYRPIELLINYRSRSFGDGKKVAFFRDPPTWIRAMLRLRRSKLYAESGG